MGGQNVFRKLPRAANPVRTPASARHISAVRGGTWQLDDEYCQEHQCEEWYRDGGQHPTGAYSVSTLGTCRWNSYAARLRGPNNVVIIDHCGHFGGPASFPW